MKRDSSEARRYLVPEVVQTSAMDCGPASLKALLEGFGIPVSYGRLREACQTDVDGSSIDTMEEIAVQLGLDAEQVMVSPDHLLLPHSRSLPAIVIVRLPNGFTHFVVIWRVHGPMVQIMDPATGRRWRSRTSLLRELYIHSMPVPASMWRSYAGGKEFQGALRVRMGGLGLGRGAIDRLIAEAGDDAGWQSLAALDAATRMVESIAASGGLGRVREAGVVVTTFYNEARSGAAAEQTIPDDYWWVRPAPPDDTGTEQVQLRGAVLVRVSGRTAPSTPGEEGASIPAPLSADLINALSEKPSHPARALLSYLRADGLLAPLVVGGALLLAAGAVVFEALLFRGLFDLGRELAVVEQRLAAIGLFMAAALALLVLELPLAAALLRFGRHLEVRLRLAFLRKIPRLGDRYFQSRPISDMAERSHSIHGLRLLPGLGGEMIRLCAQLLMTVVGIIWVDPSTAPVAVFGGIVVLAIPLLLQPVLSEQDMRARTHVGALSRFYLDALLGLVAVRTHGAERSVRREHESLLVEWARASLSLQKTAVAVEGIQSFVGMTIAAWLLFDNLSRPGDASGGVLLLVYWGLQLPMLGQTIGVLVRQYPSHRNMTLRLLEPLGAPEEEQSITTHPQWVQPQPSRNGAVETHAPGRLQKHQLGEQRQNVGVGIVMQGVRVVAAGHTILDDVELTIVPGSHLAVVGRSGAGKSSLAAILLGWHRAAAGTVTIDGASLDARRLEQLRKETVWVDPAIQIWNRSFVDNLRYGTDDESTGRISHAINAADLRGVLERLPEGLLTPLGEGGGLLSGGEGQRVRLGRAVLRPGTRLVILDEPFRGLDRERRRALLARARELWRDATLICVTHDVTETLEFDRVLVIDNGRIVEDDSPQALMNTEGTTYRLLVDADVAVREGAWSGSVWRRLRMEKGTVVEVDRNEVAV